MGKLRPDREETEQEISRSALAYLLLPRGKAVGWLRRKE